jgi:hypothetical protein
MSKMFNSNEQGNQPAHWELAAELFTIVGDRYGEVILEEELHPDLGFIKSGTELINRGDHRDRQATASFHLVSDYEEHSTHSGEMLEIHVPIDEVGDIESGLVWLEGLNTDIDPSMFEDGDEGSDQLILEGASKRSEPRSLVRNRFVIIRHITPKQRHAFMVTDETTKPYRELQTYGRYGRRARKEFIPRMIGKAASFPLINIQLL